MKRMSRYAWFAACSLFVASLFSFSHPAFAQGSKIGGAERAVGAAQTMTGSVRLEHVLKPGSVRLSSEAQEKILSASRRLVQENLSTELGRGISSRAETHVLRTTPQGYVAETIVLSLLKDFYRAEMSRIEFAFEEGKTRVLRVDKIYRPQVAISAIPVVKNATLEKLKKNIAHLTPLPQEPPGPKGLANTACSNFPSAVTATDGIHTTFSQRFGAARAEKLIGNASTKTAVLNRLQNDEALLAWNNIGHGVTSETDGDPCYGLVQWNHQTITPQEFSTLNPYKGLYYCVAFTNSCNSFKDPLAAAVWSRGLRTYIGGNINLPVARSEYSAQNFWTYTLANNMTMAAALTKAQQDKGFPIGTFGLKGDTGLFTEAKLSNTDLGMYGFLQIGKNKRQVKWNETITLTPADATLISAGKPAFEIYYSYREYNGGPASGFKNKIFFNNQLVSQQTNLSVGPKEIKSVHTQAYLGPQNGKLQIKIDADNEVVETREDNNFGFYVNLNFQGF
jgi:hypothetical protein